MQTTATYDSETGTFTIVKDKWRSTFPIADLQKWLEFYRQQRDRYPDYASYYDGDVKALEALAVQLR